MPDLAQQIRDRLTLPGAHDLPRNAIRAVLNRHTPKRIFVECGHQHQPDEPGVIEVEEIGSVCNAGYLYTICGECCSWDGYQTEHCADNHAQDDHTRCSPCPTVRDIAAELGIEVTA